MGEKIAFKNGQISDFQALVTLTLTLDRVIPSCVTHRPLTTHQIPLKSKKLFVDGHTDGCTDGHLRPTLLGRLRVDLKIKQISYIEYHAQQSSALVLSLIFTHMMLWSCSCMSQIRSSIETAEWTELVFLAKRLPQLILNCVRREFKCLQ